MKRKISLKQLAYWTLMLPGLASVAPGCTVGPEFHAPPAPSTSGYTTGRVSAEPAEAPMTGGKLQRFEWGQDLPGQWWILFGSPELNRLIQEAIRSYPDIAAQQAALRASREDVGAQFGQFFPQFQSNVLAERERVSGATIGPGYPGFISNVFQATANLSYTFDLFGGQRRTLEGLRAQAENERFKLQASYLTLMSNLVSSAIRVASLSDQITTTSDIIVLESKQLDFIRQRFEVGAQTRADVLQQESNLAQVRATLPALEQQRNVEEHALAVLTGRFPADFEPLRLSLADLTLPQDIPVSLPSSLVAQRPDIRAQESVLHAANAQVGVATANMLPQITLTGAIGRESLQWHTLFQPGSALWNVAGGVTQPIFEGGALRARRRAAIDRYEQANAQYRLTVLEAFQNVADSLTALEQDAKSVNAQSEALAAAESSLDLIQRQYDAGAVSYVALLSAQQLYSQARLALVRDIASRYIDTVSLFQSLGGGWWNRPQVVSSGP